MSQSPYGGIDNKEDVIGDFVDKTFVRIDTTWFDPAEIQAILPGPQGRESCSILLSCGVMVPMEIDVDEAMEFMKSAIARVRS